MSKFPELRLDRLGFPIMMVAAVEGQPKPKAKVERESVVLGSGDRRRDAVVDAARTLEDLSPAGVETFVRRRWRGDRPVTPEDFATFSKDALEQRRHDVVDALDHRIRRAVDGRSGAKQPHVSIPRGLGAKALASLEPDELNQVVARLRDRGWSDQQIRRHGVRRLDREGKMQALIKGDE